MTQDVREQSAAEITRDPNDVFPSEALAYREQRERHWDRVAGASVHRASRQYRRRLLEVYRNALPAPGRVLDIGCGKGDLIGALAPTGSVGVDLSGEMITVARRAWPGCEFVQTDGHVVDLGERRFDTIILSDVLNDLWDVQQLLTAVHHHCTPTTRIVCNFYSHLWGIPLGLAERLHLITPKLPQNWLTPIDVANLFALSGFEIVREWEEILMPLPLLGLERLFDRYLVRLPGLRRLALTNFIVARPAPTNAREQCPSVSVVVAARNESGHIDELVARIPDMGSATEIVFVEGNSTDDTYQAIERVIAANPRRKIKLLKQSGKGKGDAVRTGFDVATGDILMILDADITVPPEDLPRFYAAIRTGLGEFVNGVRLVYPMQDDAMRFFNLVGNRFFSLAFSWLLGQPIRDTLCGTKVLWSKDYRRIAQGRDYFGDFDPFGDFDLLFGAARQGLKIVEVPIRYRARRYGETNIRRWSHGWLLLKMVVFAARRIKFV